MFRSQSAAAAGAPNAGIASRAPDGPPASAQADDMGTTSSSTTANTQPPVIAINGNNPAEITVGDTYADLGATVTDDHDHNLGIHLYVDGAPADAVQLDTSIPGEHTIDYVAIDASGLTGTSTRTVIVSAAANLPDPNIIQAGDNPPIVDAAPEQEPDAPASEEIPVAEPANDNTAPTELPATGTE